MAVAERKWDKEDRIRATIYGNCIGDAIGLATEFMSKEEVQERYGKVKHFEYKKFVKDPHRKKFVCDWTDDSDQMILILMSILDKEGKVDPCDFAVKIRKWYVDGFPELGDNGCGDVGMTISSTIVQRDFLTDPLKAADHVWVSGGRYNASNGGVMRTSVLGVHEYWDLDKVIENTVTICGATHADPRCKASCVAVTTSIAFMLQGQEKHMTNGTFNIAAIMQDSFGLAKEILSDESQVAEMKNHMFAESLSDLKLAGSGIGYTFKTMGAGFWALRQNDFRTALEAIVWEGGDADTNGAVAGALLGCKLGLSSLPDSWLNKLKHKAWLDKILNRFITLVACSAK